MAGARPVPLNEIERVHSWTWKLKPYLKSGKGQSTEEFSQEYTILVIIFLVESQRWGDRWGKDIGIGPRG